MLKNKVAWFFLGHGVYCYYSAVLLSYFVSMCVSSKPIVLHTVLGRYVMQLHLFYLYYYNIYNR